MPDRTDVLDDRRFWAYLYGSACGSLGDSIEPEEICGLLDLSVDDAERWSRTFTGWYPGIFDHSDGWSDDPASIRVGLAGGVRLHVDFHPGDIYWTLHGPDMTEAILANAGPHWELPGLRFQEAVAIAAAVSEPRTLLLLLPIVAVTAGDDPTSLLRLAESAWSQSRLLPVTSAAARLAELWIRSVDLASEYAWRETSRGRWICEAQWSTRAAGRNRAKVARVNRLVVAACGTA